VDGKLEFSFEAEKDSFDRHSDITANLMFEALMQVKDPIDVLALGGWYKVLPGARCGTGAGYRGLVPGRLSFSRILGRDMHTYTSSHERSHIFNAVAMSPFDPGQELAILIWEGVIGAFYRWHGPEREIECHDVLAQPGDRYAALFALADPSFGHGSFPRTEDAGKLMALAGCADEAPPSDDARHVVDSLLRARPPHPFDKARYRRSCLFNVGIPNAELCRAARYMTDRIFDIYVEVARKLFGQSRTRLVIAGGCGLNCEWNTRWRDSGLFEEVFVPPCADDTGSAIGTAVDASVQFGAECHIEWDVYAGPEFVRDVDPTASGWARRDLAESALARVLDDGAIVAWARGRCEIGPRALGNRSLLARATEPESHALLNTIKQRESYRPIAPVCLEEDLHRWFDRDEPDPHMLYFRRVTNRSVIPAVTHCDGTARVQSVNAASNDALHRLVCAYRSLTGIGVLCNTSLNFKGRGFINRTSELLHFCELHCIEHAVIGDSWYTREHASQADDEGSRSRSSRARS
jgi:hydroxymethyl cephem carbamoyltransferase